MFFAKFRHKRFNAKTAYGKPSPSRDCRLRIPGARLRVRRASRRRIGNGCSSRVVVAGHGAAAAARPVIEPPGAPTGARWPASHPPCVETPPAHTAPAKCSEVAKKSSNYHLFISALQRSLWWDIQLSTQGLPNQPGFLTTTAQPSSDKIDNKWHHKNHVMKPEMIFVKKITQPQIWSLEIYAKKA